MNRSYRSLFNATLGTWVAAPETAKGHAKTGKSKAVVAASAALLALGSHGAFALDGTALPNGGTVTAGSGTLSSSGNTLTVTQNTGKLAIDWQSFNIGQNATVNFVQPGNSSIALNRVVGSDASQIYGHLNANGQVFLLNANGILFGKGSEVNVGGLVASTLSLSNADFLAGNYRFTGTAGSVVNQGNITAADRGYIALLGGQVSNQGTLVAQLGNVSLAAGSDITLDFAGDGLISLQVNQGALNALAENKQLIQADGGQVLMTAKAADSLIQAVVNNEGVIEARTVDSSTGTIRLLADMDNGVVKVGGTLNATAGSAGGFIETSGQTVQMQSGAVVKGKTWLIDPTDITIDDTEAAALVTSLDAGTDITETTSSAGTDAGDITVASAVTWTGTGTLTLTADNNIAINAAITGTNGGLTLSAGNAISAPAAVNVGTFTLSSGTWSQIGSSLPSFSATDFRISGGTFIRALSGDGSSSSPYQLADIYGVQGIGSSGMLANHYTLANDIDASGTANWNSGSGFKPIGTSSGIVPNAADTVAFTGSLDGQNHVIDGLTINRGSENYVGLFGYAGSGSSFSNLGLTNLNVTGGSYHTGGLAGYSYATLSNVYASGTVTGSHASSSWYVGGLLGTNNGGSIDNSHFTGSVAASGGYTYSYFGGLVGYSTGAISNSDADVTLSADSTDNLSVHDFGGLAGYQEGNISNSHTRITMTSFTTSKTDVGGIYLGGLAGYMKNGAISNSYVEGNIQFFHTHTNDNASYIGGLVGGSQNISSISDSHFSGNLLGTETIGGLVGSASSSSISNSYSTGAITGRWGYVGGLVGAQSSGSGSIGNSYSTATISSGYYTGGLVGKGNGLSISDSYYIGTLSGGGGSYVGGLAGYLTGSISNSYAEGAVSGGSYTGGLAGQSGAVSNSYHIGAVTSTGSTYVGGLIGYTTGAVSDSYATGNVTASSADYVGGLIGYTTANVGNTYATGDVTGSDYVGGLVGILTGTETGVIGGCYVILTDGLTISDSHATGSVLGSGNYVGGLVGQINGNDTNITSSYATGAVTGNTFVGGLLGGTYYYYQGYANALHTISNSYATGNVTATSTANTWAQAGFAGGLVGVADGLTISNSYATGNVSGYRYVGGLVGFWQATYYEGGLDDIALGGFGEIVNSYATGTVSSGYSSGYAGGLVGYDVDGGISNSYATGTVSSPYKAGGLVGLNYGGTTISNSFWNTETTGQSSAIGGDTYGGITLTNATGLTTAQMMTASTFSDAGWSISTTGGSSAVWRIYEGYTYPLLRSFLTALTVTPAYDGSGTTLTNIADLTGTGSYDSSLLLGSAASTTLTLSSSSAGSYTASANAGGSGLYSTQQGYDLSYADRTITTTGSAAGDIVISNPITWSSGTLAINTSGSISANAAVNGSGSAIFDLQSGAWSQIGSSLPAFSVYDFRLSGGSFIRALSGNGSSSNPYALADIYGVQGIGSSGMLANHYTLANDIDASGTVNWNSGEGFKPIGDSSHTFTGSFDGQSHTLDGLTIDRSSEILVGLFGINYGTISKLTLTNADVTGNFCVGALVGCNMEGGSISNVSVQGSVVATDESAGLVAGGNSDGGAISNATASGSVSGVSYVGGLVGINWGSLSNASASVTVTGSGWYVGGLAGENGGSISNSHASGNVSGSGDYVGGLVGTNNLGTASDAGRITDVYATGTVSGVNYVGGLIGSSETGSVISNAHATGNVTASGVVGGLAGYGAGSISTSYATGSVTGSGDYTGGLVGWNDSGSISASYATGNVTNSGIVTGGLVGENTQGAISKSYATGTVSGADFVGGLIGSSDADSVITNTYASGNVTGSTYVGGLIGVNNSGSSISNSYTTGNVTGSTYVGGLVGWNSGSIGNSFFNTDNTSQSSAVDFNNGTLTNVAGKTTSELQTASTFSSAGWNISSSGGSTATWRIYDGYSYPLLRAFLTSLTVSVDGVSKTYDGSTDVSAAATYSTTYDSSLLLGTLSAATSSKNVGSYSVSASGLYSTQQGYDISYQSGTVIITPATLTITAASNSKTYDGTTSASATPTYSGLMSGDTLSNLNETYASKNVLGTNGSTLQVSGYTLDDGNDGGNYTVVTNTATGTITAATLTVTGTPTAADKVYDGTTTASVSGGSLSGVIGTDTVTLSHSGAFSDKNVGTDKMVSYTDSLTGTDSGNYVLASSTGTTTADITQAAITVSTSKVTKTYDGTTTASGSGAITSGSLFGSDSIDYSGLAYAFSDKNAGTNKTVIVSGSASVSDGNNGGNYTITYADNTSSTITAKAITVSGTTASDKVYDGTTTATVSGGALSGVISGDTVSLSQSGSFTDKNVGTDKAVSYRNSLAGTDSGNYILASSTGTTTADITPATLTITANDASKSYDGLAYRGGNGVSYSGFVAGEGSSVLNGTLAYGGTSQGATAAGTYTITPDGLSAGNYTLVFADGHLTIQAVADSDDAYQAAITSAGSAGSSFGGNGGAGSFSGRLDLTIVDGGLRLPAGLALAP